MTRIIHSTNLHIATFAYSRLQVPDEGKIVPHLLQVLQPFSKENGGPLVIDVLVYKDGRPNLKICYEGQNPEDGCTGFIGSHMDVVPANPESWDRYVRHISFYRNILVSHYFHLQHPSFCF